MPLTSVVLEFAEEDLSDTTPTWVDVTSDLRAVEYWTGVAREGDEPQAGGASIRMKNTNRRWEPDYAAGQFHPNITTHRRFRLTLNDGSGDVQEGLWYVTDIAVEYPAGTAYSEVTFTCADGVEVLALDNLPLLDPPDANSYPDVVAVDEPWGYWRLGETEGTQARPRFVIEPWVRRNFPPRVRRKFRVRRGTRYSTRAEAGAVAGAAGVYKNLPFLGERSGILGDSDTSVAFGTYNSAVLYVRIPVDSDQFADRNAVTAEVWIVDNGPAAVTRPILSGPYNTTASANTFALRILATSHLPQLRIALTTGIFTVDGTTDLSSGDFLHVVGTWDGNMARIYVNGVLEGESGASGTLRTGNANEYVYIATGDSPLVGAESILLDEPAVYEYALSAERILAHYQAGAARGFPQQTAGERIAEIATHALWAETSIQTTGRDVMPQMKAGQAKIDEISELAHAEGPRTMFFFNGEGDPVYLGHEWQAGSSNYNTVQVTLGDTAGEVGYETIDLVYDNETYNEITVSHAAGEPATAGDGTPPPRRENTDYTDVLLHEHIHVESLANAVHAFYQSPQFRPATVTLNGADTIRLSHILERDIGHLIRVKRRGEGGTPIDRVTNIIGKRKTLTADRHLTCTWTLGRGFNATPAEGGWHAGIEDFSNAGTSTVAA